MTAQAFRAFPVPSPPASSVRARRRCPPCAVGKTAQWQAGWALIVNEFGEVGVDGDILKGCGIGPAPEENVVELANGCICCTVADDFAPALEPHPVARAEGRPYPDRDLGSRAAEPG